MYLLTDNISDSDSLYHIRHTWLYRTGGFLNPGFPWHQFSAVKDAGSDLWYGFHILLIPFTYNHDLLAGIKTGGIFESVILIFSLLLFFKRIKVWQPAFWTLFFISATPEMFYRMTSARPHVISTALIILLFSFAGEWRRGGKWLVFFISLLISFVHLAIAWAAPLVVFAAALSERVMKQKNENMIPAVLGVVAGLLLRPNFFGSAKLFYIQTFGVIFAKIAGRPLPFGFELEGLNFQDIFSAGVFFTALAAAIIIFINRRGKNRAVFPEESFPVILSSSALCFFFLLLSVLAAKRAMDFVFFFGIAFISVIFSGFINNRPDGLKAKIQKAGVVFVVLVFGAYNMFSALNYKEKYGHRPDVFKEAALWLLDNSEKGDIVAHFNFLDSQKLFFWNQKNYYITGFDPIFQYSFNEKLYSYLEFSRFADAQAEAGAAHDRKNDAIELHGHLTGDFHAKYLFMEKRYFTSLIGELDGKPGFKKVFESDGEIIYKVERI